jgi:alpha-tubulin suppressor-like RCC1 family protein
MKTSRNPIQIWLVLLALSTFSFQPSTVFAQPVTKIAEGGNHSLFLKGDGSLWAMGDNGAGELGDGTYPIYPSHGTNQPEQIVASNVTTIAAGGWHSLFLKSDGSLWAMGVNVNGQLGDGTYNSTNSPEQIVASNVTAIAAGSINVSGALPDYGYSLFLKNDGSLWAMGDDTFGQLGDGTNGTPPNYESYGVVVTNQPEEIVASNVTAIAAGGAFSLFLKIDGSLWGMGDNSVGELGDGTTNSINLPEQILASNVAAIATGQVHSLVLKNDGSLWAMGAGFMGQLGDGTYNMTNQPEQIVASNVTAIAAGQWHSLFLKSDGSLWAMGNNWSGQLGYGPSGVGHQTNQPQQIVAGNVTAISAGFYTSLFLKNDGSLWGMGNNYYGQLSGGTLGYHRPMQILAAYNEIFGQPMGGTNMQLSFVGVANANYALDRASSLSPPNWIPQATNQAGSFGALVFTNTPDNTTNNFWRIRSVP